MGLWQRVGLVGKRSVISPHSCSLLQVVYLKEVVVSEKDSSFPASLLAVKLFADLCPCQVKGTNIFKVPDVVEEEEPEEEVSVVVPQKPVAVPKKPVAVPEKPDVPEAKGTFVRRAALYFSILIDTLEFLITHYFCVRFLMRVHPQLLLCIRLHM